MIPWQCNTFHIKPSDSEGKHFASEHCAMMNSFSRTELDQVRREISEVSHAAPPGLTHNPSISDYAHFPGLFQKFNFGAHLQLGWSLLGASRMGGGGYEQTLGMAGEMFCSFSLVSLVLSQRQPLILTDLGLSHNRSGTGVMMPCDWTQMPSFEWWLSLQVAFEIDRIHYVPNVKNVLNWSILAFFALFSNFKSWENGLILWASATGVFHARWWMFHFLCTPESSLYV